MAGCVTPHGPCLAVQAGSVVHSGLPKSDVLGLIGVLLVTLAVLRHR
jgi:hypothetical protein